MVPVLDGEVEEGEQSFPVLGQARRNPFGYWEVA